MLVVLAELMMVFWRPGVIVVPLTSTQEAWTWSVVAAAVTTLTTSDVEVSRSIRCTRPR